MDKKIVVNRKLCLACKQCVVECAMAHCEATSLVEAINSDNPPQGRLRIEPFKDAARPVICHHCRKAKCIEACPNEAIGRREEGGPVLLDADLCDGCELCLAACPFGVIKMSHNGKVAIKCDLCPERTAAGEDPACVWACPTGALEFRDTNGRREESGPEKQDEPGKD